MATRSTSADGLDSYCCAPWWCHTLVPHGCVCVIWMRPVVVHYAGGLLNAPCACATLFHAGVLL
eukprot:4145365-Pyramimonas_sp.AAC.1